MIKTLVIFFCFWFKFLSLKTFFLISFQKRKEAVALKMGRQWKLKATGKGASKNTDKTKDKNTKKNSSKAKKNKKKVGPK